MISLERLATTRLIGYPSGMRTVAKHPEDRQVGKFQNSQESQVKQIEKGSQEKHSTGSCTICGITVSGQSRQFSIRRRNETQELA